jgi:GNAT superfamily N-acetyltransferase
MTDLLVRLYDLPEVQPYIEELREQGVLIRTARPFEKQQVVDWVCDHFGSRWADECDAAFGNRPISCFIGTENGEITGFACYDSTCRDFFGPTGVAPHMRGRGIGRALLLSCLHAMAAIGYAYAVIGGVRSDEFYRRVVAAIEIEGSSPGIYRDRLRGNGAPDAESGGRSGSG